MAIGVIHPDNIGSNLLSIIFIWVLLRVFGGIIIGNWIVSTIEKETRRKMRE